MIHKAKDKQNKNGRFQQKNLIGITKKPLEGERGNLNFSLSSLSHISENKNIAELDKDKNEACLDLEKKKTPQFSELSKKDKCEIKVNKQKSKQRNSRKENKNTNQTKDLKKKSPKSPDAHRIDALINANIVKKIKKSKNNSIFINYKKKINSNCNLGYSTSMIASARNEMIRKMNAKSLIRSRPGIKESYISHQQSSRVPKKKQVIENQAKRQAILVSQRPSRTESERRATLGLTFLDILNAKKHRNEHMKTKEENQKSQVADIHEVNKRKDKTQVHPKERENWRIKHKSMHI